MDSCFENLINVKPGYWRQNDQTDQIYQCLRIESCLGGESSFTCQAGYVGGVCGQCDYFNQENNGNFVEYQYGICINCLTKTNMSLIALLIIVFVIITCFYFTKLIIEAHCKDSISSLLLRTRRNFQFNPDPFNICSRNTWMQFIKLHQLQL